MKFKMKNKFLTCVFIFCCLVPDLLLGNEKETLSFRHITPSNGLSHFKVFSVSQDDVGYIWFGTNYGLDRYDGFSVKSYYSNIVDSGSLSSSRISCLLNDSRGNLWIGTRDGGINLYLPLSDNFISFSERNNPIKNSIHVIFEDKDNCLWVGAGNGGGLNRFDYEDEKFINYNPSGGEVSVLAITELNSKLLLIGTENNGILLFDKIQEVFLPIEIKNPSNAIKGDKVLDIKVFGDKVWVSTIRHTFFCPLDELQATNKSIFQKYIFSTVKKDVIVNKMYSQNNALWFATNQGLIKITKDGLNHTEQIFRKSIDNHNSLINNLIYDVYVDKSGVLWCATDTGVSNADLYSIPVKNITSSELNNSIVNKLFEDSKGNIWIGLRSGIVGKYNPTKDILNFSSKPLIYSKNSIEDIVEDNYGYLWIASWGGGVNRLFINGDDQKRFQHLSEENLKLSSNIVTALANYSGDVYIGTQDKGLVRIKLDNSGNMIKSYFYSKADGLLSNTINNLYFDSIENCLWVSTPDGLNKLMTKRENIVLQAYTANTNSLSHNFVWEVCRPTPKELYVGTIEDGLNILTFDTVSGKQTGLEVIRTNGGLLSNSIQSIIFDEKSNSLWLGGKGIVNLNITTKEVLNYSDIDEIKGTYFRVGSGLFSREGMLFFGSEKGINIIQTSEFEGNIIAPKVLITACDLYASAIDLEYPKNNHLLHQTPSKSYSPIVLPYRKNSISFDFIALHYAHPIKNKYSYRLKGFDDDWIKTSSDRRFATYSSLPYGKYLFEVNATNGNGIWSDKPATLEITIQKPFWLTLWAFVIYAIVLSALFFVVFKVLSDRQKMRQDLEFEKYRTDKNEELALVKLRFFTNISHELRTPLTLIVDPLESILRMENLNENLKFYLNTMHRNSIRLLKLFNQLLDFRKAETGNLKLSLQEADIVNYVKIVASSFSYRAKIKNIDFQIHSNVESLIVWIDKDFIEKIIFNLLSNAFRHTDDNGKITVDVNYRSGDEYYTIVVADDGVGISQSDQKYIFNRYYQTDSASKGGTGIGLAIVERLVKRHYGEISLDSQLNMGSNFFVSLPIGDSFMKEFEKKTDDFEITPPIMIVSNQQEDKNKELVKILIVDDNAELLEYLNTELSDTYDIIKATNGKDALEKTLQKQPALIISDVVMPVMDGVMLCKEIKSKTFLGHIPIILLTAKTSEDDRLLGISSGADAYIGKPFRLEFLRAKIKNLIEERQKTKRYFAADKEMSDYEIDPDKKYFLYNADKVILDNLLTHDFDSKEFAKQMNMSYGTLYNKLKLHANSGVTEYIRFIRLKEAAKQLANTSMSISEVTYNVGFNNTKYFRECFKKLFRESPSDFIKSYRKNIDNS